MRVRSMTGVPPGSCRDTLSGLLGIRAIHSRISASGSPGLVESRETAARTRVLLGEQRTHGQVERVVGVGELVRPPVDDCGAPANPHRRAVVDREPGDILLYVRKVTPTKAS
jgi:hypothetical protein